MAIARSTFEGFLFESKIGKALLESFDAQTLAKVSRLTRTLARTPLFNPILCSLLSDNETARFRLACDYVDFRLKVAQLFAPNYLRGLPFVVWNVTKERTNVNVSIASRAASGAIREVHIRAVLDLFYVSELGLALSIARQKPQGYTGFVKMEVLATFNRYPLQKIKDLVKTQMTRVKATTVEGYMAHVEESTFKMAHPKSRHEALAYNIADSMIAVLRLKDAVMEAAKEKVGKVVSLSKKKKQALSKAIENRVLGIIRSTMIPFCSYTTDELSLLHSWYFSPVGTCSLRKREQFHQILNERTGKLLKEKNYLLTLPITSPNLTAEGQSFLEIPHAKEEQKEKPCQQL